MIDPSSPLGTTSPQTLEQAPLDEISSNRAAWQQAFSSKFNFSEKEIQIFMKHITMSVMSAVNKMMRKSREKLKKMRAERGS